MYKKLFFIVLLSCITFTIFSQIKFVCIGNSISHGKYSRGHAASTSIGDSLYEMSYRFWFWEKVDSVGINATMVGYHTKYFDQWGNSVVSKSRYTGHTFVNNHEAYYGIKSDGFIAGGWNGDGLNCPDFDTRMAGYTPDVALIHIGTNDAESTTAEVDASEANIRSIITKLRNKNPNVTVLLARLMTDWKLISARMSSIAASTTTASSIVVCVDMATGFINNNTLPGTMTFDWVHPNPIGQKFMSIRWYNAYMNIVHNDSQNPTDPSGLAVSNVKATTVDLTWNLSTDNLGVNKYNIYANDVLVTTSVTKPCTVTGLTSNTLYTFKVEAVDVNNNKSNKSTGVNATTTGGFNITFTVNDGTVVLQNAEVTYASVKKLTDATGKAIYTLQNSGNSSYQILKKGYKTLSGTFNLTKDTAVTYILLPDCSIKFTITDVAKKLQGAKVTFSAATLTTDANGQVTFNSYKPASYSYSITFKGYKTASGNLNIADDSTLSINLLPDCLVAFNVTSGGNAVENAAVTFNTVQKTTDNLGKTSFADQRPGIYTFTVKLTGYDDFSLGIQVKDDTTFNVVLNKKIALPDHSSDISVFPNPANNMITIINADGSTFEILDILGKVALNGIIVSSDIPVDISALATGIYFIRIINGTATETKSININR